MYEHLALSDNGFLFDTRSGATYSLSRTGTFLLRELMRGTHPSDLAARLTDAFEVDLPAAARDCEQFLFRVKDLALLDEASDDDDDDPGSPRAAEPFGVCDERARRLATRADGRPLTVAVTGLNATDNPGPGVPVIRAIRAACPDCRIVGLAYDALDPGNYMDGIADDVWLMPYPSQGAGVLEERLRAIHATTPLDAVIPTLDSELPTYLKLVDRLRDLGIGTFLPTADMLRLRGKDRLDALRTELGVSTPRGVALTDPAAIGKLDEELDFPVMVKGQFYDAAIAYSPMDVHAHFERFRAKWGVPVIVQEFVAGEEYDVVALGDGEGLVGSVAMRKMQLTDKGKAWGGVTVADRKLDAFVRDTMAKLRWRGPCELEVMKASDGSGLYLIEINPRFPAWVYLSVGAGRNLPWAAVQLALGEHVAPMPPAPAGVMFLRHSFDQICSLADYSALTTLGELHHAAASSPATAEEVAR